MTVLLSMGSCGQKPSGLGFAFLLSSYPSSVMFVKLLAVLIALLCSAGENAEGQCGTDAANDARCALPEADVPASLVHQVATLLGCVVSADSFKSLDCIIRQIYSKPKEIASGRWRASDSDDSLLFAQSVLGEAGVYGALTPVGLRQISAELGRSYGGELSQDDVFLDAGSGDGKLPVQLFLHPELSGAFGVEMHPTRCALARAAIGSLSKALDAPVVELPRMNGGPADVASAFLTLGQRRLGLLCGDMLTLDTSDDAPVRLSEVSVFYTNSLCFPASFMSEIYRIVAQHLLPGALVLTSRALPGCHRGLVAAGRITLKDTDSVPEIFYAYVAAPPLGMSAAVLSGVAEGPFRAAMREVQEHARLHVDHVPDKHVSRFFATASRNAGLTRQHWDNVADHRATGEIGTVQFCLLSELAKHILLSNVSSAWRRLVHEELNVSGVRPLDTELMHDSGDSLYHIAVELRSGSLLQALWLGDASPGPCTHGEGGSTICHREVQDHVGTHVGRALSMLPTLQELDGPARAPAGSLLPLIVSQAGDCCTISDARGRLPLHLAAAGGRPDVLQSLLEMGGEGVAQGTASTDQGGRTPLHFAEDAASLSLLLDARGDASAVDLAMRTPLQFYIERIAEEGAGENPRASLALLIERRGEVNAVDKDGHTPLHAAAALAEDGLTDIVAALLAFRSNIDAKDSEGRSPLLLARDEAVISLLVEARADVTASDVVIGRIDVNE